MLEPIRRIAGPIAPIRKAATDDWVPGSTNTISYTVHLSNGMLVTNPKMFPDARGHESQGIAPSTQEERPVRQRRP
jgi:hypothetical protein